MKRAAVHTLQGEGTGQRPAIALYSMAVGQLYRSRVTGNIGGAEVQYSLLARELSADHDVHVISLLPAPLEEMHVPAGHVLHLLEVPRGRSGTVWALRLVAAKWRALKRARPRVAMQRGAGLATFTVALWCRAHRVPFLFHWASDANALGPLAREGPGVAFLYRTGRRWARWQVCQTEHQRSLLPAAEQRRASVIPNMVDDRIPWRPREAPGSEVLWLGTVRPTTKRPDLFLDLAASLPHRRFRMVGEWRGSAACAAGLRSRLAGLPNVTAVGFVARERLPEEFARARCLVNTSDVEGFPNTFLEACASGVPVVSRRVDPGGLLEQRGAGRLAHDDPAALRDHVEAMFDDGVWKRHRQAALQAVAAHRPATAADRTRRLLQEA